MKPRKPQSKFVSGPEAETTHKHHCRRMEATRLAGWRWPLMSWAFRMKIAFLLDNGASSPLVSPLARITWNHSVDDRERIEAMAMVFKRMAQRN